MLVQRGAFCPFLDSSPLREYIPIDPPRVSTIRSCASRVSDGHSSAPEIDSGGPRCPATIGGDSNLKKSRRSHGEPGGEESGIRSQVISPGKRRIFLLITLLVPILILVLAELALRVFHYGPDLSLFIPVEFHGRTYAVMNPMVGARYFSGGALTPAPSTEFFTIPKPSGTYRIFCLGGSTVVGFPYWHNGSFAAFLRVQLQRLFPDRSIEVINLGMTAVNSYTVLDLAKELPAAGADLLVVYDGHNEFYGALGVASHQSFGGSRTLALLYLRLIHIRLFLAMRDAYAALLTMFQGGGPSESRGPTLEFLAHGQYVPYGSSLYDRARDIFSANLDELRRIARDHAIPILLLTQVSNLRDQFPFASIDSPDLPAGAKTQLDRLRTEGENDEKEGRMDSALAAFRAAAGVDSLNAGVRFQMARCLDSLGRWADARAEYSRARDYDQLRFRASGDFNSTILEKDDGKAAGAVDMERLFMGHSPDSLIGHNIILDHLHPTSYGHFLMAKGIAEMMRERGLLASREEWQRRDTVSDSSLWAVRPLTAFDERVAARRVQLQCAGWPFDQGPAPDISPDDTLGIVADHVADGSWGWGDGHLAAINFYTVRKDWKNLESEYRAMIGLTTYDVEPRLNLAYLQVAQKRYPEARATLQAANAVEPTAFAFRTLGAIAFAEGDVEEAIRDYEMARKQYLSPEEDAQTAYALGLAYLRAGKADPAELLLRHVVALRPNDSQTRALLNSLVDAKKKRQQSSVPGVPDTLQGTAQ